MMVLITYDVNTEDSGGRKRLRQIAKQCVNYGQRVQNSVFECLLDAAQCKQLQHKLLSIMDKEKDSLLAVLECQKSYLKSWNASKTLAAVFIRCLTVFFTEGFGKIACILKAAKLRDLRNFKCSAG